MSRLRQTIARRLKEAQNTAAMLTTFNEADERGHGAALEASGRLRGSTASAWASPLAKAVVVACEGAVNARMKTTTSSTTSFRYRHGGFDTAGADGSDHQRL